MPLTFAVPSALWWLSVVPLVWVVAAFSRTNFDPRQRYLQAAARSLLLVLLTVALAQPVWSTVASRVGVVYLVDVSHSVAPAAIAEAAARIDAIDARIKPDVSRIVAFGTRTQRLADTRALRAIGSAQPGTGTDTIGRDGSDLELALAEARAALGPGEVPRVVLFSDGRETRGDVRGATLRLAAEGIPVFVEPLGVRDLGDAWVDGVQIPDVVPAGALVTVTPLIGSQRAARNVTVEIHEGGRLLASRITALEPGLNPVAMEVTFASEGSRVVEVTLNMAGDVLAANNRFSREVVVDRRTRALYVEGTPASASYLQRALTDSGFDVTLRDAAHLPLRLDEFDAWDVVILSDVAKASIPDAAARALARWVEQDGGGLFFAGGDAVFGEAKDGATGGYRRSEIERLLPVTLERKDEPDVALVMVLDKSWSMNGPVMELCKSAAQAAVDALSDEQIVGLVTFDDRFTLDITPRNVGANRDDIRRKIAAVQPGGDTLIYPALEQAYLMLRDVRAGAKHIVLLSDGRSYPDDYQGLVNKMTAAKMTVSSIAVGPAADAQLLLDIAKWGRGRGYVVRDAKEVPQIFVKEAKSAMPAFDEGDRIQPVVKARGFLSHVDLAHLPELRGRTAMVLKDSATELIATPKGEPLLAFWPIGLGRTAAFASDVKDRWATSWVKWPGYAPFFSALLRSVARQRHEDLSLDLTSGVVHDRTRAFTVFVEARDPQGRYRNLLKPSVDVRAGDGGAATVPARQVAPGRYEASLTADADQPLTVSLVTERGEATRARHITPDPDEEYRLRPTNETVLRSVAMATGGRYAPALDDFARPSEVERSAKRAVWPALVVAALVCWLGDIWLRRVRLFEATPPTGT